MRSPWLLPAEPEEEVDPDLDRDRQLEALLDEADHVRKYGDLD